MDYNKWMLKSICNYEQIQSNKMETTDSRATSLKIKTEASENLNYIERSLSLKPATVANVNEDKLKKLTSLITEIEQTSKTFFQFRLLLSTIKEAVCENNSENLLIIEKIQQIIAADKVASFVNHNLEKRDEDHESLIVLGLEDHHKCGPSTALSYSEKINLKSVVEDRLLSVYSRIQKYERKAETEFSMNIKTAKDITSSDRFEFIKTAHAQFQQWYDNLTTLRGLLKELIDMRLAFLGMVRKETIPWFEARCKNLEFVARILELEILAFMFNEEPNIPEAIKKIDIYTLNVYEETKSELDKLRNDEKAYDRLIPSPEYDSILKTYKQYKRDLNNTLWVLNELS